ncbi:hypothetical protein BCR35DRAFT_10275 [Leucosporidium creatinivorum]|uniref:Uncharacterized protein n=1 Tax=Leucosporidium creatinivorum TaxID=106004 RepID=A0A1Y2G4J9_9BASI|nr:hypothetical protein BCR35DRAFT_10275 [Leucosporidium creatinivorum]
MVSSFENGNVSHHDGDVWYGAIPDTNVTLGSYDDACIPDANRPVTFDESQLSSIRSCEPTELTWSGSAPPYEVWIYTQNTLARPDAGLDRISLGTTNETSITWDVDFPAGLAYFVEVQAADSLRSYAMNAAVRIEGETGNCTIPEQHELINPISAASLSSVASSFWVLVPSVLLWMAVA